MKSLLPGSCSTQSQAPGVADAPQRTDQFVTDYPRARVVFGEGAAGRIASEIDRFEWRRVLLVTTAGRATAAGSVREALGPRLVAEYDRAAMHVPVERVREAVALVDRVSPDVVLAVGGGSPIGLAKAAARELRGQQAGNIIC